MEAKPIIYGRNAVLEALRAQKNVRVVYVARGAKPHGALNDILTLARAHNTRVDFVPRDALDRMTPRGANHQGVVVETEEYEYAELEDLLAEAQGEPAFLLALDGVQDVQNLGTLLRTAEAVGVHGVILLERRAAGVTGAVRKASAGAVDHLKIARVKNLARTIDELKRAQVWVYGVEDVPNAQDYGAVDYTVPVALVLGSEGAGLSRLIRDKCDVIVKLPMYGKIASLNVAVAGSIVLYEAKRQRVTWGE